MGKLEFMRLSEAVALLECTLDALLDKGIAGELDIYAPVLDEGVYVWPVTERGLQHSQVMGAADPIFEARFLLGDYMILPPLDVKKVRLGSWVIPEGFIGPALTSQFIDAWEAGRQKERAVPLAKESALEPPLPRSAVSVWLEDGACERMRALVRRVPWVPLARATNSEGGGQPARDEHKITTEVLRVCSDDIERLRTAVPAVPPEMFPIDDAWDEKPHVSDKLRTLIMLSERWKEKPHHEGISKAEYLAWHNSEIERVLLSRSAFYGRSDVASRAAEFIRPLYARRSVEPREHALFRSWQAPELRALYHASRLWSAWTARSKPTKAAVAEEIRKCMHGMQRKALKTLLEHGPKIIQPESADSGREGQAKKAQRATKKK
ncbi:hypothetical protein ACQVRY_13710 [Ralstonia pseudosolanacearum]